MEKLLPKSVGTLHMSFGEYDSQGAYCGPYTASSVFLIIKQKTSASLSVKEGP